MSISFFAPIHSRAVSLGPEKCAFLNITTHFFNLGQKAYTIRNCEHSKIMLLERKVSQASWVQTLLRVVAFITVIIPLLMLIGLLIYRAVNNFEVIRFENAQVNAQLENVIKLLASTLSVKDLLNLRATSKSNLGIVESILIERLNQGRIILRELGIKTAQDIRAFFGSSHSKICSINLQDFADKTLESNNINATQNLLEDSELNIPQRPESPVLFEDSQIHKEENAHELVVNPVFSRNRDLPVVEYENIENAFQLEMVVKYISSALNIKDILNIRATSNRHLDTVQSILIEWLNKGMIILKQLGIHNTSNTKDFFGSGFSMIRTMNLQGFPYQTVDNLNQIEDRVQLPHVEDESIAQEPAIIDTIDSNNLEALINPENLEAYDYTPYIPDSTYDFTPVDNSVLVIDSGFLEQCSSPVNPAPEEDLTIRKIKFSNCPLLTTIDLSNYKLLNEISFEQECSSLTSLDLSGCYHIKNFNFLKQCPSLKNLNLSSFFDVINDFSFLKECISLTSLNLSKCEIKDFNFLKHLSLTSLNLSHNNISDISFLTHSPLLTNLNLSHCSLTNTTFLRKCPLLLELDLSNNWKIDDVSFLEITTSIKNLNLEKCWQIQDFSSLEKAISLKELNTRDCLYLNCKEEDLQILRDRGITVIN